MILKQSNFIARQTSVFLRQNVKICAFPNSESWVILNAIEQRIKSKIEAVGTPLKNWNINIYRGVLTGYNEAFIIDGRKKDKLISEDPKSAEIIRPILRGRDINRFGYNYSGQYLIALFPSKNYNIEDFPAVKKHLLTFGKDILIENGYGWLVNDYLEEWCYKRLDQTGNEITINGEKIKFKGSENSRKATNNKWFETQDSISYWDDFNRQKIVWIELADKGRFAFDSKDHYITLNGTFIMIGEDLEYLCCVLNNPVTSWHFNTFCISSGVGTNQWRELYVRELFIPDISLEEKMNLVSVFNEILVEKNQDVILHNQNLINHLVYKIMNLDDEEIEFIESQ